MLTYGQCSDVMKGYRDRDFKGWSKVGMGYYEFRLADGLSLVHSIPDDGFHLSIGGRPFRICDIGWNYGIRIDLDGWSVTIEREDP